MESRPLIKLLGEDNDASVILEKARKVGLKAGWDQDKVDSVLAEMKERDYSHLLRTVIKHFNVH